MSLKGKVAIITGSSSGIGESTALLFAEGKTKVVLAARNEENLNKVATACRERGLPSDHVLVVKCDLTIKENLQRLVDETIKTFGQIDVLVNNAGVVIPSPIMASQEEDLNSMLDVNLKAIYNLSKLCVPQLIKTKGSIINISTILSMRAFEGFALYATTKAALDAFTKGLAVELAPQHVRVNSVKCEFKLIREINFHCNTFKLIAGLSKGTPKNLDESLFSLGPGMIRTNMLDTSNWPGDAAAELVRLEENMKRLQPLGGVGDPRTVAKAIRFLASDDADFITGQILSVDSGWNCKIAQ